MTPLRLAGEHARLEPLSAAHVPGLAAAAAEDRGSYAFTRVPDGEAEAEEYVRTALAEQAGGQVLPFAVLRTRDDAVVGSTRFLDMEVLGVPGVVVPDDRHPPSVVEIGSTWYASAPCSRASGGRTPPRATGPSATAPTTPSSRPSGPPSATPCGTGWTGSATNRRSQSGGHLFPTGDLRLVLAHREGPALWQDPDAPPQLGASNARRNSEVVQR